MLVSLPLITVFFSSFACIFSYLIGINNGKIHRLPFVPYVSDTGDLKPHSSVFTFGMIMSSGCTLAILIVKFYQIKNEYKMGSVLNKVSFSFGLVFVFGKIIVACFQLSSYIAIHFIGAGLYFVGVTLYATMQTYITYKMKHSGFLFTVRFCCVFGLMVNLGIFAVFMIPGLTHHNRNGENVAQSAEWTLVIFKCIFMLTFTHDFWQTRIKINVLFSHNITADLHYENNVSDCVDGRRFTTTEPIVKSPSHQLVLSSPSVMLTHINV